MPIIPGLPKELIKEPGVSMTSPPEQYIAETEGIIHGALKKLKGDQRGLVTWVLTEKGVNVAVVDRVNDNLTVTAWVGKTWGAPIAAGIAGTVSW